MKRASKVVPGGLYRIFAVVLLVLAEGAVLSAPALGENDPAQGCAGLYQRRNRDHCRQQVLRKVWPCQGLPVQDLEDMKNCAILFDYTVFPGPQSSAQSSPQQSAVAPPAAATAPTSKTAQAGPPQTSRSADNREVLALRISDEDIAAAQAAQRASLDRRRIVDQERTRVASRLGVDPDAMPETPASSGDREVLALYEELAKLRAESGRLSGEIQAQNAILEAAKAQRNPTAAPPAETPQRPPVIGQSVLGASLLAFGILLASLLAGGLILWRRRVGLTSNATRVFPSAKPSAEKPTPSGYGSAFQDCVLEGGDSDSFRLAGSLLPESAGGVIIGRHAGQAQVVIDRPEISRRHAKFVARGGEVMVEDLGSANGTLVEGVALRAGERRAIRNGALVQFGPHRFTLRIGPSRAPG